MGFNPQIWGVKTLNAMREAMLKRVRVISTITDYTQYVEGTAAEGYNGPKIGTLTAVALPASSGDVNSPTNTAISISFDQKVGVPIKLSDIDKAQTNVNLINEYTRDAVNALLDDYDLSVVKTMIGGLTTDATQRKALIDSTNLEISEQEFINAKAYLNSKKAPTEGRTCLISPVHEAQLYAISNFISRDKISDTNAVRDGVIGRLHGFDIILYNDMPLVSTAGKIHATAANNTKNCTLFYQSLILGFGRQKAISTKYQPDALTPGDIVNIYSVYGKAIQDGTYGYLVYDAAS